MADAAAASAAGAAAATADDDVVKVSHNARFFLAGIKLLLARLLR